MSKNDALKFNAKNLSVLYAEDEADIRKQVSELLRLFFKKVYVASNGDEALKLYKAYRPDLIMTDLTMPKINGLDMIKQIKDIYPYQHVIVLTAHNSSEDLMETIDLQIDGFLLKPIKMVRVLDLLLKTTHTINLEINERQCIQSPINIQMRAL